MALNSAVLLAALNSNRVRGAFPLGGPAFPSMAVGIAQGLALWAVGQPQNLGLVGASTGVAGVGNVTSPSTRLFVPDNTALVLAGLVGAGVRGQVGSSLAAVVSGAVSQAFTGFAQYVGVSAGVGVGIDVSRFAVINTATLQALLFATLGGSMGSGVLVPQLAAGLALGITQQLLLGAGTGTVVGTGSPVAATGITNSTVV